MTPTGVAGQSSARRLVRRVVLIVPALLAAGLGSVSVAPQGALAAVHGMSGVAANGAHSCVLRAGRAYCWGEGSAGQLGDGTLTGSSVPVPVDASGVLAGQTLTQITAGYYETCALDSSGAAYCWGSGDAGQLGDGTGARSTVPAAVSTAGALAGKTLTQISSGYRQACALDSSGAAYCWGNNGDGELGDGSLTSSSVPVPVDASGVLAGKTLTQISVGATNACAVDTTGAAYCWGNNSNGQLGDGSTTSSAVPVAVNTSGALSGKQVTQVSSGNGASCAVATDGAGYCWGNNSNGQFGDGSTTSSAVPVPVDASGVLAGQTLTQISLSVVQACAIDAAGAAFCWGNNSSGGLGDGSTTGSDVPVPVDASGVLAGQTLTQISVGNQYACALARAGAVYCWGGNLFGELGDGTFTNSSVPVAVVSLVPQPPGRVTGRAGDHSAAVSWTAPASLGTGTLTGYTATAVPGRRACSTRRATRCTITGLRNGRTYTITVITRTTAGNSAPSTPVTVTPHARHWARAGALTSGSGPRAGLAELGP